MCLSSSGGGSLSTGIELRGGVRSEVAVTTAYSLVQWHCVLQRQDGAVLRESVWVVMSPDNLSCSTKYNEWEGR